MHTKGDRPCGGIAFYYLEPIAPYDVLKSDKIELIDGTTPGRYDFMMCGACGQRCMTSELEAKE